MKLTRLSAVLLLALALLGGGFVVAPEAAAETDCVEHCDDTKKDECTDECADDAASVVITGGTVTSSTTLDISVDGGTAISDASGGDFNVAINAGNGDADVEGDNDVAAAGNGGTADASANGGAVSVGSVNSGGNSGNTIVVGNTGTGDCHDCECKDCEHECKDCEHECKDCKVVEEEEKKVVEEEEKKVTDTGGTKDGGDGGGGRTRVDRLASTGVGVAAETGANDALILLAALGALGAAGYGLRRRFV